MTLRLPVLGHMAGPNSHADSVIFLGAVIVVLIALGFVARHRRR